MESLTDRELQVLSLVAAGSRNYDIASELHVTVKTVEFHLTNILGKLGVRSRTEAVVRAVQLGWLALERYVNLGTRSPTARRGGRSTAVFRIVRGSGDPL